MTVWKTLEKTNHSQSEILSQLIEESDAIVVGIGACLLYTSPSPRDS